MRITFISDTHGSHRKMDGFLPGGDLLVCAGDISGRGEKHELDSFFGWYHKIEGYKTKILICGNHDWGFQRRERETLDLIKDHGRKIEYLEDKALELEDFGILVYGSPWQPQFLNWAFNLPRMGDELKEVWDSIPEKTDILVTHGPPFGILDYAKYSGKNVGCELLLERVKKIKPKIHVFGHIHEGAGYVFDGDTHFINASILDENYYFRNKPINVEWDPNSNEIEFINE